MNDEGREQWSNEGRRAENSVSVVSESDSSRPAERERAEAKQQGEGPYALGTRPYLRLYFPSTPSR